MIRLTRIAAERNLRRFYLLDLQPTLFGDWDVVREWGRLGQGGRVRHDRYRSQPAAAAAFDRIITAKTRRGYRAAANLDTL